MSKISKIFSLCLLAVLFLFSFSSPASATAFGEWELREPNIEYFAETAGMVVCNANSTPGRQSSAIATTPGNIVKEEIRLDPQNDNYPALYSFTLPVRQGDTWQVIGDATRYCLWLPFVD